VLDIFRTQRDVERRHLLREELTQSLGLMNDTNDYPDSIFYQAWTITTQYSEIDKKIIRLLYHQDIKAGMNRLQVEELIKTIAI
jgi:hypothetical protein